jgi:hypothetical protein
MSIKQRLRRLEARRPPSCPDCADGTLVIDRCVEPEAAARVSEPHYCPRCGRELQVIEVVEIVVSTREEVERCRAAERGR